MLKTIDINDMVNLTSVDKILKQSYEKQEKPEDILKNNNIEVKSVASDIDSYVILLKNKNDVKKATELLKKSGFECYVVSKLIYVS